MEPHNNDEQAGGPQRPIQKWAVAGLIAFFFVGVVLAAPCLCPTGAVKGLYKSGFLLVAGARLLYGFFKRNLTVTDYALWTGGFLVFCVVVESL